MKRKRNSSTTSLPTIENLIGHFILKNVITSVDRVACLCRSIIIVYIYSDNNMSHWKCYTITKWITDILILSKALISAIIQKKNSISFGNSSDLTDRLPFDIFLSKIKKIYGISSYRWRNFLVEQKIMIIKLHEKFWIITKINTVSLVASQ